MKLIPMRALLVLLAMLLATGLSVAAKPRTRVADQGPRIDLEVVVPPAFGAWRMDTSIVPVKVSADVQAKLDKLYSQTLSRTYVNDDGVRVMLSVAYGGDQSDAMQVHKPEVCYAAQGFRVLDAALGEIRTRYGSTPVKRLVATLGARNEPITYWIVVGNHAVTRGIDQKLAQLRYGLTGRVPDGLLVRVSSIDRDAQHGYRIHEGFINDMLVSMSPEQRNRVIGTERQD
jgi:EpsI family protein